MVDRQCSAVAGVQRLTRVDILGRNNLHAGFLQRKPLEAHFGLGKAAESYRVEVVYSGSKTRVVRENVMAGQRIVIREDEVK